MNITYKKTASNTKPLEIDVTSSEGVYIRRNIKEVTIEDEQYGNRTEFQYEEAYISQNDYETYKNQLLFKLLNDQDNSSAYDNYLTKLDTPVEYPVNGFTYKPKWAENIYAGLIQKGQLLPSLFPLKIYDSTEEEERAANFSLEELVALSIFLAGKQEEYFAEYKAEKKALVG